MEAEVADQDEKKTQVVHIKTENHNIKRLCHFPHIASASTKQLQNCCYVYLSLQNSSLLGVL